MFAPPHLPLLQDDDRWQSHQKPRQLLVYVLTVHFLCVIVFRMAWTGPLFGGSVIGELVSLFLLLCGWVRHVRDSKVVVHTFVMLWIINTLIKIVNIISIVCFGRMALFEPTPNMDIKQEFITMAPLEVVLVVFLLVICACLVGVNTSWILRVGTFLLFSCIVCLFVAANESRKFLLRGAPFTTAVLAICVLVLVLYMIFIQEKMRLSALTQFQKSQQLAEEWLIKEDALKHQKDQAISYIFHEVRNPVNAINMAAELAVATLSPHEHPERETLMEMMDNIVKAADLATVVLNDVLNAQRLEQGSFSFAQVPFHLAESLRQVVRVTEYQTKQKNIELTNALDTSLDDVFVLGDGNRLKQVILNLMNNAYKFTPHGGHITVSSMRTGDICNQVIPVRISVSNNGPEIKDTDRSTMFHPWAQLRAGEQKGMGSGLGLALCKEFVEKGFGGTIDFTSNPTQTTFFFDIRFHIAPTPASLASSGSKSSTFAKIDRPQNVTRVECAKVPEPDCVQVDVLVVDDSAMNRNLMHRMLVSFGITVEVCENGKQAVELLTGGLLECKLVLMDKEMPVMDGYAATQALRESVMFCGYIVGLTGNALDTQVSEFLSHGVDEVITKPVKRERIHLMLHKYGLLRVE
eukprot:c5551_g1_i1.p1 GENE.c5551_g1_i1~~c5551_g1_i1.p1  ORF type:complete len:634 (+),score=112.42 c5551_g1_i1:36-1937(+)